MTEVAKPPRRERPPANLPEKIKYRGYEFPVAIGDCADLIYALRQNRAAANKVADAVDAEYKALQEYIIDTLPKTNTSGVAGEFARVQVTTSKVPQVEDWEKFYAYVEKNGALDLLQRRVNDAAVKARWDNDEEVPGVKTFNIVKLSITKI